MHLRRCTSTEDRANRSGEIHYACKSSSSQMTRQNVFQYRNIIDKMCTLYNTSIRFSNHTTVSDIFTLIINGTSYFLTPLNEETTHMWHIIITKNVHLVMFRCSPGDVRRQVPVRLVQEDLHALRHLLLQQPRLRPVQVLRLNTTINEPVITTQQERKQQRRKLSYIS